MEMVGGFFDKREQAVKALAALASAEVDPTGVHVLMPGGDVPGFEAELRGDGVDAKAARTFMERVGIGGFAGAAVASVVLPGVGPVFALGSLASTVLATAADRVAHADVDQNFAEASHLFHDALSHGKSVVVVNIDGKTDPVSAREILVACGAVTFDEARDAWWTERRESEARYYETTSQGADFDRAERAYRRGYEAALEPRYEGRGFEKVALTLRDRFRDREEADFRRGYERAQRSQWEHHDERVARGEPANANAKVVPVVPAAVPAAIPAVGAPVVPLTEVPRASSPTYP
ncbi:MAG: hypothetical protein NVSMB47_03010 [Polyangiales bacterium]